MIDEEKAVQNEIKAITKKYKDFLVTRRIKDQIIEDIEKILSRWCITEQPFIHITRSPNLKIDLQFAVLHDDSTRDFLNLFDALPDMRSASQEKSRNKARRNSIQDLKRKGY